MRIHPKLWTVSVCAVAIACGVGIRANAATIAVTYSFAGAPVGTPVISGTTETVDHLSTGSVVSGNPSLNAILNPFTLISHDVVDFMALTLNGASTITFADGSTLFGRQFVDFSKPLLPETLTFTGGTGEFAGATGSFSGESVLLATGGFTVSGRGIINAPAIVPEPASIALAGLGIAVMAVCRRRRRCAGLLALSFALCATSNVFAQGPTFTTIDYPGSTSTIPWGFNTRGDIVGFYTAAGVTHGFLLNGGQYRTIDFPGASSTDLRGINPQGDITGIYTMAGVSHGFLLSGGQFSTIDFPGGSGTVPWPINARGDIGGSYVLAGVTHGFLLSGGQFSTIDFPGSSVTSVMAINPQGDLGVTYTSGGVAHVGLLIDGDFTTFDFPGATYTNTTGSNARGDIVGRYIVGGVTHGYVLSGGQFSTYDFPGATFTGGTGINQRGDILGRYTNADNVFHGFLMTGFRQPCVATTSTPKVAAVTHSTDFTLVTAAKPAAAGEVLSVFATGLGPTRPSVGAGQPFPASTLAPVDSLVEVRVNGRSTIVLGAYGLPGAVDGYQVNFRLPADTAKGSAAVELSAGGVAGTPVNVMVQ